MNVDYFLNSDSSFVENVTNFAKNFNTYNFRVVRGDTINSTVEQLVRHLSSKPYDLIKTIISQYCYAFI